MDVQREQQEQNNQTDKVVSGFAFYSEKDARLAEQERQKIAYLDKRIDHGDIQSVLAIYKKALEDRVFRTPVGLEYLRELQGELCARKEELGEEVPPIPLWTSFADVRTKTSPARRRIQPVAEDEGKKAGIRLSVIMNIVMIVVCDYIEFRSAQYPELRAESSEQICFLGAGTDREGADGAGKRARTTYRKYRKYRKYRDRSFTELTYFRAILCLTTER